MILALDPSSSITGYAILSHDCALVDCGLIKPEKVKDEANARIRSMANEVLALIREHKELTKIVIEDTSGFVARRHGAGGGRGLAIMGKAIGWVIAVCEATGIPVTCILENVWTAGVPKIKRIRAIAAMYRMYDVKRDRGGDCADAIGIGVYYCNGLRTAEAA